jgi:uncharacterized protein (DUF1330 family)
MRSLYRITTAALGGLIAGAALVTALQAQSASTHAYFIGNVEQITDQAAMDRYHAEAPKTEAAFGGKIVARGTPQALDASAPPKGTIVIIEFPNMKTLKSWWQSPAYAAVRPIREQASVGRFYAVDGLPAP